MHGWHLSSIVIVEELSVVVSLIIHDEKSRTTIDVANQTAAIEKTKGAHDDQEMWRETSTDRELNEVKCRF